MLPFHIRLALSKLTYYSITSKFSRYFFKTGILCLLFLSSHVFAALQFDINYFGIILSIILELFYQLLSYFEK